MNRYLALITLVLLSNTASVQSKPINPEKFIEKSDWERGNIIKRTRGIINVKMKYANPEYKQKVLAPVHTALLKLEEEEMYLHIKNKNKNNELEEEINQRKQRLIAEGINPDDSTQLNVDLYSDWSKKNLVNSYNNCVKKEKKHKDALDVLAEFVKAEAQLKLPQNKFKLQPGKDDISSLKTAIMYKVGKELYSQDGKEEMRVDEILHAPFSSYFLTFSTVFKLEVEADDKDIEKSKVMNVLANIIDNEDPTDLKSKYKFASQSVKELKLIWKLKKIHDLEKKEKRDRGSLQRIIGRPAKIANLEKQIADANETLKSAPADQLSDLRCNIYALESDLNYESRHRDEKQEAEEVKRYQEDIEKLSRKIEAKKERKAALELLAKPLFAKSDAPKAATTSAVDTKKVPAKPEAVPAKKPGTAPAKKPEAAPAKKPGAAPTKATAPAKKPGTAPTKATVPAKKAAGAAKKQLAKAPVKKTK